MGRRRPGPRSVAVEVKLVASDLAASRVGVEGSSRSKSRKLKRVPQKIKVRGVSSRCSFSQVYDAIQSLSDRKKELVEETGFGGLLNFPPLWQVDRMFVVWLMGRVDALDHCIVIDDDRKIKFSKEDLGTVFGIPSRGIPVMVNPRPKKEIVSRVWCDILGLQDSAQRRMKSVLELIKREHMFQMSERECVAFKVAFVIYMISTVLAPGNRYDHVYLDYAEALLDHSNIGAYDWAGFVFRKLIDAITNMKLGLMSNNKLVNITGCSLFLQVIYLDSIDLGVWNVEHKLFPRVIDFSADRLKYMIRADTEQCQSDCMDRKFGTRKLLPVGRVCYSWARSTDCLNNLIGEQTTDLLLDATASLARLFNIDDEGARSLFHAVAGLDTALSAKIVCEVASFFQRYVSSGSSSQLCGAKSKLSCVKMCHPSTVSTYDVGQSSDVGRSNLSAGSSVQSADADREGQLDRIDASMIAVGSHELKDPWELGFVFSYFRDAAGVMIHEICALYGSSVLDYRRSDVCRMLKAMQHRIFGVDDIPAGIFDAVLRCVKSRDDYMYRSYRNIRWRHFVATGVLESVLSGKFDGSGSISTRNFDPCYLGYHVSVCKLVFFPCWINERWVCYAWKPLLDKWTVFDPVAVNVNKNDSTLFHVGIVKIIRDAVSRVHCLSHTIHAYSSDTPEVLLMKCDERFSRKNRSGVGCLYFCTMFDGVSIRGEVFVFCHFRVMM
ncbi:unnamed protein product [Urochloa decumbens]|uniref:Aminotransferase-like plant mobile domain-containing protein n=1 Tax=Urochloa decumbens TaxID=240449 RepID=A0ABC9D672_9POAL